MYALPAPSPDRDLANHLAIREAHLANPHLRVKHHIKPPDPVWTVEIHHAPKGTRLYILGLNWCHRTWRDAPHEHTLACILATTKREAITKARRMAVEDRPRLKAFRIYQVLSLKPNVINA